MQVLFALVPLVAFYLAESWYGLQAGVALAILFAVGQLSWDWFRHRRLNRLVVFGTVLIVVLGGLSWLSDDERFVLWSPVVSDFVFAGIIVVGTFATPPLQEVAIREADPTVDLDDDARRWLRRVALRFGANLALHGILTAWATTQSRETWLLVSGPVQYGMIGLQGIYEYLRARGTPRVDASDDPV